VTPAAAWEPRILVVDDEPANVQLLQRLLAREGYARVQGLTDPVQALEAFRADPPDLLLLDLHMPRMDGLEVLARLAARAEEGEHRPVLVLTADVTAEARERALRAGAHDFVLKPFDATEVLLRIRTHLRTRELHLRLAAQNQALEARVRRRTAELEQSQLEVLQRLAQAAELRDDDTGQHTRRVGELAAELARALGVADEEVELIRRAAPLHDVGKIGIPDAILLKPERLDPAEFAVMKTHAAIGARMLAGGRSPLMRMAERIALTHHERWDGSGYPGGLTGEDIPLAGRIVAVADFYDALAHDRPYRGAWALKRITGEIAAQSGRHFDPRVAERFLAL
jgi:putative two-component system response regulator